MEKLSDFLAMGGYAAFVWPAFAVAVGILALIAYLSHRTLRRYQVELARLEGETRDLPAGEQP
ncbi:heme exporter protein CcmD [Zavarzinia sp. CC-PAN008]|uniref:heme exporter protein CcmD n=1 Tax=Zavarzinia sp. CC-PAN008 TaxID=3243332 RepID=UPI003F746B4E